MPLQFKAKSNRVEHRNDRAAANGYRVLEHIHAHPVVSVNDVQELIRTTYPAANGLVVRMVGCGILHEFTGQARHRRFRYQDYIDLFHDTGPEAGT